MLEMRLTSLYPMMTVRSYSFLLLQLLLSVCLLSLPLSPTAVTVEFSSATYSVSEGDEFANVSVELTGTAEREVRVLIHTENGTATGSLGKLFDVCCLIMLYSYSSSQ